MAILIAQSIEDASLENYSERRIVGRALRNWEALRTHERIPLHRDCLASFVAAILPGKFLIEINQHDRNDVIGPDLVSALGRDPVGLPVQTILPSSTDRWLIFWRVAAERQKPIADIGSFTNAKGLNILYRCIFLPVSEEGGQIAHVLGAFSYRLVH
jgi:hypothetical protein